MLLVNVANVKPNALYIEIIALHWAYLASHLYRMCKCANTHSYAVCVCVRLLAHREKTVYLPIVVSVVVHKISYCGFSDLFSFV